MAALIAIRFNPILRLRYQQLLQTTKLKTIVLVDCAHKLLVILNAILRDAGRETIAGADACST
jgi:transposase